MVSSIPPWVILFLIGTTQSFGQEQTAAPRCPPGTLNDGWIVQRSYAFADPLDCCDRRVQLWQAFDDYETPYTETGCSLVTRIQGEELSRFIAPIRCSNSSICGDQDFFGNKMQCCPSNDLIGGYCAAIPASGESRCERVAELIQWSSEEDEEKHQAAQDFARFSNDCYSASVENFVCLACSSTCPDGFQKSAKSGSKKTEAASNGQANNTAS